MRAAPPLRVITVFVRAGTAAYAGAEERLERLFATQLPGISRDVVVVDNLLPEGIHEQSPRRVVIGGDNSSWEFSGVDVAVRHVGAALWQYDLVNVVTSAFEQLYTAYLERFRPDILIAIRGAPVCVGHIDCYNSPITVISYRSQHWLRSCFLMLPVAELRLLGSLVSAADRRPWFSGNANDPFAPGAPLCATYRQYLLDWLLGKDIGQGVMWHRALARDEAGLDMFEQKARMILNEHLLGIRLRAAGCRLIDVTWLSSILSRRGPCNWDTPWWTQLSERDRDAISIRPQLAAELG